MGNSIVYYVIFDDALALLHNPFDNQKRDWKLEMDSGGAIAADNGGYNCLFCCGAGCGCVRMGKINTPG